MAETVRIVGAKEVERSFRQLRKDVLRELRPALREAGNLVRADAQSNFSSIDARSAAGYKVRVRKRGVAVEQSLRRTTGQHPSYGALQMRRALLPALNSKGPEALRLIDQAINQAERDAGF
jgi:hypothetical protein